MAGGAIGLCGAQVGKSLCAPREKPEARRGSFPLLTAAGGVPEEGGSLSGALHRAWIDIKAAVTQNDAAILAECERGEATAVDAYKDALAKSDVLPEPVVDKLREQFTAVQAAHARMQTLADADSS